MENKRLDYGLVLTALDSHITQLKRRYFIASKENKSECEEIRKSIEVYQRELGICLMLHQENKQY